MKWITAHWKAIIAAVGAVAILVVDQETVDIIIAALTALGTLLVPNNPAAVEAIYHKRGAGTTYQPK